MYNFSIGGGKKDPYSFAIGGSSSSNEPKKGFGLTGSLSKNGGLSGGLQPSLMTSQTKKASSSYTSGFGGGFGDSKSIADASKSAQGASKGGSTSTSAAASKITSAPSSKTTKTDASQKGSKKGSKSKFGEDIIPRRFGLKYDPPTITLEYMEPNSGKLYHHKMKLKKLQKDTDIKDAIEYLRKKHETYLSDETVSDSQLKSLIERLKTRLNTGKAKPAEISKAKPAEKAKQEPPKKSNSLTPLSNNDFKSQISSGSTGIRGANSSASTIGNSQIRSSSAASNSKQPAAATSSSIYGSKPSYLKGGSNDYDDDEDDDQEEVFKYAWNKKGAGSIQTSKVQQQDEYDYYNDEEDEEEEEEEDEEEEDDYKIDYNTYNLNKLSNDELQKHKDKMEKLFKENNLKPGDKGFQYNVEEDFDPDESNEWDEDL